MNDQKSLFFDIETTGLSPASSHITVIGTLFYDGTKKQIRQFICKKPTDEKKILTEFSRFAFGFTHLIHYNGTSFDIPYLRKKCSFYRIEDPFGDMPWSDLYLHVKKIAPMLSLAGCKQKSAEAAFGFKRSDTLSGADVSSCYRKYLLTGDQHNLDLILLHNKEDLLGMVKIHTAIRSLLFLKNGDFTVTKISCDEPDRNLPVQDERILSIYFQIAGAADVNFKLVQKEDEEKGKIPFELSIDNNSGIFSVRGENREMKYFFENYKDYFFLPVEGRAVHKSVGQFVDPKYRIKATKETACEAITAVFFPQSGSAVKPVFKPCHDSRVSYFRFEDIKDEKDCVSLIKSAVASQLN